MSGERRAESAYAIGIPKHRLPLRSRARPGRDSLPRGPVGRTLRGGVRVLERLYDSPLGELYRAGYPSGGEVVVLLLGTTATQSVALAALQQCFRQAIQIQHPNVAAIYAVCECPMG